MSYSSKKYPRNKNMIKIKIVKNGLDLHHPPPKKKNLRNIYVLAYSANNTKEKQKKSCD